MSLKGGVGLKCNVADQACLVLLLTRLGGYRKSQCCRNRGRGGGSEQNTRGQVLQAELGKEMQLGGRVARSTEGVQHGCRRPRAKGSPRAADSWHRGAPQGAAAKKSALSRLSSTFCTHLSAWDCTSGSGCIISRITSSLPRSSLTMPRPAQQSDRAGAAGRRLEQVESLPALPRDGCGGQGGRCARSRHSNYHVW